MHHMMCSRRAKSVLCRVVDLLVVVKSVTPLLPSLSQVHHQGYKQFEVTQHHVAYAHLLRIRNSEQQLDCAL